LTIDFSGNKNYLLAPVLSYLAENQPGVHQFYVKQSEREKCIAENVLVDIVTIQGPGKASQANIGANNY
jgi:hypothetical protein